METIDILDKLIECDSSPLTLENNQELFSKFFLHDMSIRYGGKKVINIYNYLLSLNKPEALHYVYLQIFNDFNYYEQYVTQSIYMNVTKANDLYVDTLEELIEYYNLLKSYASKYDISNLINENQFVRDYTGTMVVLLNKGFFKISSENIKKMLGYIKNNSYLQNVLINGYKDFKFLDQEYIIDYVKRFLINADLIADLDNDYLLMAMKRGLIKDKKLFLKILDKINIDFLDLILDNGASSFVNILELTFPNINDRIEIFQKFYQKFKEAKEYSYLLTFIVGDKRSKDYVSDEEEKLILNKNCLYYPMYTVDEDIEYFLSTNPQGLLLANLKENLKRNDWSKETNQKVREQTKKTSDLCLHSETVIPLFNLLFKHHTGKLTFIHLFAALKRMIIEYLHDDSVIVYLTRLEGEYGASSPEDGIIKINVSSVKKMFECNNYEENPEAIHILDTVFHEARHIMQYRLMQKKDMSPEIYEQYKEEVLKSLNVDYYNKNYKETLSEIDARLTGAKMVVDFLKEYYPYMINCIKYYDAIVKKEEERIIHKKNVLELADDLTVDEALEKIIAVNPKLLEKYPGLQREYELDGTKKEKINHHL
ncbi:MAG: hypothetical protein SPK36_01080 [Bacilli bacterium]|nr:hypothetical protein [Bacilli bacterium]